MRDKGLKRDDILQIDDGARFHCCRTRPAEATLRCFASQSPLAYGAEALEAGSQCWVSIERELGEA